MESQPGPSACWCSVAYRRRTWMVSGAGSWGSEAPGRCGVGLAGRRVIACDSGACQCLGVARAADQATV